MAPLPPLPAADWQIEQERNAGRPDAAARRRPGADWLKRRSGQGRMRHAFKPLTRIFKEKRRPCARLPHDSRGTARGGWIPTRSRLLAPALWGGREGPCRGTARALFATCPTPACSNRFHAKGAAVPPPRRPTPPPKGREPAQHSHAGSLATCRYRPGPRLRHRPRDSGKGPG